MKFQLNFIRDRAVTYRLKVLRRIIFAGLLLGFVLCGAFMGRLYINNWHEIRDYQNELASISKSSPALNEEIFKIVEYNKEWDSLYEKISLVTELARKKFWWTPKLEALGRLIPDNIWLSKISIQLSRKEVSGQASSGLGSLILEGFAQPGNSEGFRSVQNFAQELKKSSAFNRILGEIDLTTTLERKGWEPATVGFWLSCPLVKEESL